jgi:hypothetical protein
MKKGQVPTNPQSYAALLVFVIGLALIIYILMLPPSERALILDQNKTTIGGEKDYITVIMTKEPGTLSNIADTEIIKDLPAFSIYSRTDTESLLDFDSVYVKKSLFEEQARNLSFKINNPGNTNNYLLSFTAPKHKGILTIILNGNILTSDEYTTASPGAIKLPRDWLMDNNNLTACLTAASL